MSTFQPPINLDPNQDSAQQIAFINQNFQNLASTLESNSFRIVQNTTHNTNAFTISASSNTYFSDSNVTTIPHGLNFAPLAFGAEQLGSGFFMSPSTQVSTSNTGFTVTTINLSTDTTNIYITVLVYGFTPITLTNSPVSSVPVTYILVQIAAS